MTETVVTIGPNQNSAAPPPQQTQFAIQFNFEYFLSLPGILKLIQLICGILCMAVASPAFIGATHFFLFVAVVSFILTLLWTFAYLLGIREGLNLALNWILTELVNTAVVTILYFIASIVQLTAGISRAGYIAAGVFGIINAIAYAAGAYFLFLLHKSGTTQ